MFDPISFLLNFDQHLLEFVRDYGVWIYGILFAIVFAETGCVITPFLPGDSLLFAAGALSAVAPESLNPLLTPSLLFTAAVLGDGVNYSVGRRIGPRIFRASDTRSVIQRVLNRDHLARAHEFFERYGGKAVVLGRFVPIVRTFVPFVAGAARMTPGTFVLYNITGGALWVALCFGAGYLFGNVPFVKNNFSLITITIVVVSVLPMVYELVKHWRRPKPPIVGPPAPPVI
jgi:membrane-associated protein